MGAKKGNVPVLVSGIILMLAGMLALPFCNSKFLLMVFLGVVLPTGTGALSYGIIMGTITPNLPQKSISNVSGIVNASSGIGNILMSPVINSLIVMGGLFRSMIILSIPMTVLLPISIFMGRDKKKDIADEKSDTQIEAFKTCGLLKSAFKNKTYIFLLIGFLTCGFHMAIITNHLPTELLSYKFKSDVVSYAFSIFGITTIIGSVLSGILCGKMKMKNVLGGFYGLRPLITILFFVMPTNIFSIYVFTALLGFTGAATVPPVSGIVGKIFGVKSIAILFGFVFVVHQIGGFLSAWLGGICFEMTGGYLVIWLVDITLCFIAAWVSFSIKEDY